jgi:hypothetical protein
MATTNVTVNVKTLQGVKFSVAVDPEKTVRFRAL